MFAVEQPLDGQELIKKKNISACDIKILSPQRQKKTFIFPFSSFFSFHCELLILEAWDGVHFSPPGDPLIQCRDVLLETLALTLI